jgi:hypothetical protein
VSWGLKKSEHGNGHVNIKVEFKVKKEILKAEFIL